VNDVTKSLVCLGRMSATRSDRNVAVFYRTSGSMSVCIISTCVYCTPSFGGEVKPSVPCRKFAACKRSLELRGNRILGQIFLNISRPRKVPPSTARGLSRRWT
jgi:hypothetical protein